MSTPSFRKFDSGTTIAVTLYDESGDLVALSGASAPAILFRDPCGNFSTKTATVVGNTVQYVTAPTDFVNCGNWMLQAQVTVGSWTGTSESILFRVDEVYE